MYAVLDACMCVWAHKRTQFIAIGRGCNAHNIQAHEKWHDMARLGMKFKTPGINNNNRNYCRCNKNNNWDCLLVVMLTMIMMMMWWCEKWSQAAAPALNHSHAAINDVFSVVFAVVLKRCRILLLPIKTYSPVKQVGTFFDGVKMTAFIITIYEHREMEKCGCPHDHQPETSKSQEFHYINNYGHRQ